MSEPTRKSRVAVVRCESYADGAPDRAVRRALELLGGSQGFVSPGERIVLKPNVLVGDPPERASTTHPAVFEAVARTLLEVGARLSYGDAGAVGSAAGNLRRSGLAAVAEALAVPQADFDAGRETALADSPSLRRFFLARGVLDADGLVSIPKMKTHGFMQVTGAVKNQLGCVPGLSKAELHLRVPDPDDFARMLVALTLLVRPRLYVMDGVVAMEGNGPRGGSAVAMNVILASGDPVALDATFCRLVRVDPALVPTNVQGARLGLGRWEERSIDVVGDSMAELENGRFRVERGRRLAAGRWARSPVLKGLISPRPVIDRSLCVRCGVCVGVCPVRPPAIDWGPAGRNRPPRYDYDRCIRCFCCQETCPESAIRVRRTVLGVLTTGA